MSAAFNLLEKDLENEETNAEENAIDDDDAEDDEDEEEDSVGIKIPDNRLAKASMSESYSEILNSPTNETEDVGINRRTAMDIPSRRPNSLNRRQSSQNSFPHGSVRVDDSNMTHFVADNLEYRIKIASPSSSKKGIDDRPPRGSNCLPSESASAQLQQKFLSSVPQIDANALNDIEIEAQYLASNIDGLTENLCNLLHSISSIAADNVECHKNAVNKLTDCMDANIKTMYTIMAKTEEISNKLKSTEALAARIRDIRRLVDMLDNVA